MAYEYEPKRPPPGGAAIVALVVVMMAVALVTGLATSSGTRKVRSVLGLDPEPLAQVPLRDAGNGTFKFMQTQPGRSKKPVAYDPCRKIEVVVNPEDAPDGYLNLVETAMTDINAASGLQFELVGQTDERPREGRRAQDVKKYGEGWSPVLVAWADSDEVHGLAGDVAGLGGSLAITQAGWSRYVTGVVTLDEDGFGDIEDQPNGRALAQALIDHEFGHLVGLGHVDDPGELMAEQNAGKLTWGPGDLAGLSRLGRGRCF